MLDYVVLLQFIRIYRSYICVSVYHTHTYVVYMGKMIPFYCIGILRLNDRINIKTTHSIEKHHENFHSSRIYLVCFFMISRISIDRIVIGTSYT